MMDLMYFGYSDDTNGPIFEKEFKDEIAVAFPTVRLEDAYDTIKGYRQEVHLSDDQKDNYLTWIIGNDWLNCSLDIQLIMRDPDQRSEFERLLILAKKQYL